MSDRFSLPLLLLLSLLCGESWPVWPPDGWRCLVLTPKLANSVWCKMCASHSAHERNPSIRDRRGGRVLWPWAKELARPKIRYVVIIYGWGSWICQSWSRQSSSPSCCSSLCTHLADWHPESCSRAKQSTLRSSHWGSNSQNLTFVIEGWFWFHEVLRWIWCLNCVFLLSLSYRTVLWWSEWAQE